MHSIYSAIAYLHTTVYEPWFQNQPTSTAAFRGLCLLVLIIRAVRELQWALVFSPLLLFGACAGLSGLASLVLSPMVWGRLSQLCTSLPSVEVLARVRPLCTRAKIECRAAWKRVHPALEAKCAVASKAALRLASSILGPNHKSANAHAALAAAVVLAVYTICSSIFWALHRAAPASMSSGSLIDVPLIAGAPTLFRPFVFLHVPGSAGVAYRTALNNDVATLKANRFMPCYGGLKCTINTDQEFNRSFIAEQTTAAQLSILQREMRCATVIAGHFKVRSQHYDALSGACASNLYHLLLSLTLADVPVRRADVS